MRTILSICVIIVLSFTHDASAQNADPICAGLTGAAFGQCTAALAVGCDGSATQPTGCTKISENFTRLTGATPPWEPPTLPCSCFALNTVITDTEAHLASGQPMVWYREQNIFQEDSFGIFRKEVINNVGVLFPDFTAAQFKEAGSFGFGACVVHEMETFGLSVDEIRPCIKILRIAASVTGIPEFKD